MSNRPYTNTLTAELAQMISASIQAKNLKLLHELHAELCHRKSSNAKRLKAQISKYLSINVVKRREYMPEQPRRFLGPGEKSIFELEQLAEAAMRQDLVEDVQVIFSLLTHRHGIRSVNLKNKLTIYLWDHGLLSLLPSECDEQTIEDPKR